MTQTSQRAHIKTLTPSSIVPPTTLSRKKYLLSPGYPQPLAVEFMFYHANQAAPRKMAASADPNTRAWVRLEGLMCRGNVPEFVMGLRWSKACVRVCVRGERKFLKKGILVNALFTIDSPCYHPHCPSYNKNIKS